MWREHARNPLSAASLLTKQNGRPESINFRTRTEVRARYVSRLNELKEPCESVYRCNLQFAVEVRKQMHIV